MIPPTSPNRPRSDPTLGLINVVFLMVMFFLIAGTLTPSIGHEVDPVTASASSAPLAAGIVVLDAGGVLRLGEATGDPATIWAALTAAEREPLRLLPDRSARASDLIAAAAAFRALGAKRIVMLTEMGEGG